VALVSSDAVGDRSLYSVATESISMIFIAKRIRPVEAGPRPMLQI